VTLLYYLACERQARSVLKRTHIEEKGLMKASVWSDRCAVLFAAATVLILVLAYIPLLRARQGWEDEVYWASTCLSMLRHKGAVPSVLADYPRPFSPPLLYGPVSFWLASVFLKTFGFSMRTWRSFTFAGDVAYLVSVGVLFYRLRRSWAVVMGAVLFCSLSLGLTLGLTLPGRPDSWTLAIVVGAFALAAGENLPGRAFALQWIMFGVLLALAASATPRIWPLLGLMTLLLPLRLERDWLLAAVLVGVSWFVAWSLLLMPLHMTIWRFIVSVHGAGAGDAADVSPIMGGRWSFNHAHTQTAYFAALLLVVCVVDVSRWRRVTRYQRWLIVVAVLNLASALLLTARSLNMIEMLYWGFVIEIAALCAWTEPASKQRLRIARAIGVFIVAFLVILRASQELLIFRQWSRRDPRLAVRELRAFIPSGSIVYGPSGTYFYPALTVGAEYRNPVDWASKGRASTPGQPNLPTPMRDACHAPAFLVWPTDDASAPFPPMPHATRQLVARYEPPPANPTTAERWLMHLPGVPANNDVEPVAIYRLVLHPGYCQSLGMPSPQ
jgi:hypothetical protein